MGDSIRSSSTTLRDGRRRSTGVNFLVGTFLFLSVLPLIGIIRTHHEYYEHLASTQSHDGLSNVDTPSRQQREHLNATLSRRVPNKSVQGATPSKTIVDFERQEGVVIATKIHDDSEWGQLQQSLCLLTVAYNDRVNYDIVIFSTMAIPEDKISVLRDDIVAPAQVTVVVDSQSLQEQLEGLTPEQSRILLERCNKTSLADLDWTVRCWEHESHTAPLQYLWQAEFRSKHLWTQDILKAYRIMLWFDTDAMPMKVWEQDPVTTMLRNDLVLLFDNFGAGNSFGPEFTKRIRAAYPNHPTLCYIFLQAGHLKPHFVATPACPGPRPVYPQIHGFFHLTNLNFYRQNLDWANQLIGDTKFSRKFDDQIAVTIPAAVVAPDRAWDMYAHGLNLSVMHNGLIDGKDEQVYKGWYKKFWKDQAAASQLLPREGITKCHDFVQFNG